METDGIQIIVPVGMFGESDSDTALDWAMREIAKACYPKTKTEEDQWWDCPGKYGCKFENDVFLMHPDYQDAECTCGFSTIADQWHNDHPCADDCYYKELHRRFDAWDEANGWAAAESNSGCDIFMVNGTRYATYEEAHSVLRRDGGTFSSDRSAEAEKHFSVWKKLYDRRSKEHTSITKLLCREREIPWNRGLGSYVHCTCGKKALVKEWFAQNGHEFRCPIQLPQFWYKPLDFQVRWYKYIGRDMKPNRAVTGEEIQSIFTACMSSIAPQSFNSLQSEAKMRCSQKT